MRLLHHTGKYSVWSGLDISLWELRGTELWLDCLLNTGFSFIVISWLNSLDVVYLLSFENDFYHLLTGAAPFLISGSLNLTDLNELTCEVKFMVYELKLQCRVSCVSSSCLDWMAHQSGSTGVTAAELLPGVNWIFAKLYFLWPRDVSWYLLIWNVKLFAVHLIIAQTFVDLRG